jgi:translation initiation factor 2B subunit (eIF-2B alpha/beta/delta family)
MVRLDSLKSISHHNRDKDQAQNLDKIEEENFEDDDAVVIPAGKSNAAQRSSTLGGIKSQLSQSSLSSTQNVGERLKDHLLTAIDNLIADIESVPESIASQANDHIHSNDVILTYG